MKIWTQFAGFVLGTIMLGCSTSNEDASQADIRTISPADYHVIMSGSSGLFTKTLSSNSEGLYFNGSTSLSLGANTPSLSFSEGTKVVMYQDIGNCAGIIVSYDFNDTAEISQEVFSDVSSCDLTVTAIAGQADMVFLSYVLDTAPKEQSFFVRSINLTTGVYKDFILNEKPTDLVVSNAKLFVLTWDENRTEKNALTVLDYEENTKILEMDEGSNVGALFKKTNGDIVLSYPDSHTTLDSNSLSPTYTRYVSGTEPHFWDSENNTFDASGNMYYIRNDALNLQTETIVAMYDFDKNGTLLYYFENFLNEAQLKVEFNIKSATAVSFDNKNNLILIGYDKNTEAGGGIIRITPAPDLTFVDNFDLDDIPFLISPNE